MFACTILAHLHRTREAGSPHISREQRVDSERPSLPLVICSEDDKYVFYTDHECQGPDDEREGAEQVIVAWIGREGAGINVKRACTDVAVDDSNGLVSKPEYRCQSLKLATT